MLTFVNTTLKYYKTIQKYPFKYMENEAKLEISKNDLKGHIRLFLSLSYLPPSSGRSFTMQCISTKIHPN